MLLAKQVHQHKMQNVDTSDDERKGRSGISKFKRKQNRFSSICEKKIQEIKEQDYLSLKGSRSVSDLNDSKEISRYQPSKKERVKAMKDALSAIRQFTSEGNLSRNGNLNTTTMKEMWDYESWEPFSGETRDVSEVAPEKI